MFNKFLTLISYFVMVNWFNHLKWQPYLNNFANVLARFSARGIYDFVYRTFVTGKESIPVLKPLIIYKPAWKNIRSNQCIINLLSLISNSLIKLQVMHPVTITMEYPNREDQVAQPINIESHIVLWMSGVWYE